MFYTIFDPVAGPTIIHQVPEGSIATRLSTFPSKDNGTSPAPAKEAAVPLGPSRTQNAIFKAADQERNSTQVLFDFSSILEFVIPKPELCGHLITKATRTSKILGFPVRSVKVLPQQALMSLTLFCAVSSMKTNIIQGARRTIVTPSASTSVSSLKGTLSCLASNQSCARLGELCACWK